MKEQTIQSVREELKKDMKYYTGTYLGTLEHELELFNLGVELAQKEFLDLLENHILKQGGNWLVTKFIRELQEELKQKLGSKI